MRVLAITLLLLGFYSVFGQIVEIPDENFKEALLEQGVDTNGDNEIQISEAEAVKKIEHSSKFLYIKSYTYQP